MRKSNRAFFGDIFIKRANPHGYALSGVLKREKTRKWVKLFVDMMWKMADMY